MSGWITDGLRTLENYFGDEVVAGEEYSSAASSSKGGSSSGKRQRDPPTATAPSDHQRGGRDTTKMQRLSPRLKKKHQQPNMENEPSEENKDFWKNLERLKEYIVIHGHANVPFDSSRPDNSLHKWIEIQRSRRRALPQCWSNDRVPMSRAEIDALDAIGFEWDPAVADKPPRHVVCFRKKIEELEKFKAKHGGADIYQWGILKTNASLYNFVKRQRQRRSAYPKPYKQHRAMTKAEIDALDAIGFVWEPPPKQRRKRGEEHSGSI